MLSLSSFQQCSQIHSFTPSGVRRWAVCWLTCAPATFEWSSADLREPTSALGTIPWRLGSRGKAAQASSHRGTRWSLVPAEKTKRRAVSVNIPLSSPSARRFGHSPRSSWHPVALPRTVGFGLWLHLDLCIRNWPFWVQPWSIAAPRWSTPAASGEKSF